MQKLHPTKKHLKPHTQVFNPCLPISFAPTMYLSVQLHIYHFLCLWFLLSLALIYNPKLGIQCSYTSLDPDDIPYSVGNCFSIPNNKPICYEHWETTEAHFHTDENLQYGTQKKTTSPDFWVQPFIIFSNSHSRQSLLEVYLLSLQWEHSEDIG